MESEEKVFSEKEEPEKNSGKHNRHLAGFMRSKAAVAAAIIFIAAGVGILLFILILPNAVKAEQKTAEAKEAAAANALAAQDYETAKKGYLDAYNAYISFNSVC